MYMESNRPRRPQIPRETHRELMEVAEVIATDPDDVEDTTSALETVLDAVQVVGPSEVAQAAQEARGDAYARLVNEEYDIPASDDSMAAQLLRKPVLADSDMLEGEYLLEDGRSVYVGTDGGGTMRSWLDGHDILVEDDVEEALGG